MRFWSTAESPWTPVVEGHLTEVDHPGFVTEFEHLREEGVNASRLSVRPLEIVRKLGS